MAEQVLIRREENLLSITLARPERRNAITIAMYAALADAIEEASGDERIRVITIEGQGQDFAAGNDLADFVDTPPRLGQEIPVWRMLRLLAACETPIVAAVHGNCVGIGTTMLLHCDLVIADETARFSMPFVDLGLVPEAASSLLFPRIAGRRDAARYLLLGEPFGAEEARSIGLVSHLAASATLGNELDRLVRALLAKPPEALRATQRLLRHGNSGEILERMKIEGALFADRLASPEAKQAINAFFAKRAASKQA